MKDTEAYVRKTAAICVVKLFDINPELVIERFYAYLSSKYLLNAEKRGFLTQLQLLLGDPNPMVVANCTAALSEIKEKNCNVVQNMNFDDVFKLMNALNACTEYAFIVLFYKFIDTRLRWGQVFILDAIATYHTDNEEQILQILHQITPRLQHANHAVVLSAIQVLLNHSEVLNLLSVKYQNSNLQNCQGLRESEVKADAIQKIIPPLITLMNSEQEIQFVALRNIRLVIQRYPSILRRNVQVCKSSITYFLSLIHI